MLHDYDRSDKSSNDNVQFIRSKYDIGTMQRFPKTQSKITTTRLFPFIEYTPYSHHRIAYFQKYPPITSQIARVFHVFFTFSFFYMSLNLCFFLSIHQIRFLGLVGYDKSFTRIRSPVRTRKESYLLFFVGDFILQILRFLFGRPPILRGICLCFFFIWMQQERASSCDFVISECWHVAEAI